MFKLLVLKKEQVNVNSFSQDFAINSISEFKCNQKEEVTFVVYFHCYDKVFQKESTTWSDKKKIHMLLRKFGKSKHEKYANYILLRNPGEISFEETILML